MDEQIFKKLAASFESIADFSYEFTVGKNGKRSIVISSLDVSEFTHIVGLDHIPLVKTMVGNNSVLKKALFEQMLRGDFTYSDLTTEDIVKLNESIPNTYNMLTKLPYSIKDRITGLVDVGSILDNAYEGRFYKWDNRLCKAQLASGKRRNVSIRADYVFKIPSEKNADENYYFFMVQSNKYDKRKSEPIKLFVISAFLDCIDITKGQERPYTILQESKINIKTKQSEILYTHPSYEKQLSSQSVPQQADNIKKINFENEAPQKIILNSSGAATVVPAPNPFGDFLAGVKKALNKVKEMFAKQDKQPEERLPENTVASEKEKEVEATVDPYQKAYTVQFPYGSPHHTPHKWLKTVACEDFLFCCSLKWSLFGTYFENLVFMQEIGLFSTLRQS